jgi:hypothetical protein
MSEAGDHKGLEPVLSDSKHLKGNTLHAPGILPIAALLHSLLAPAAATPVCAIQTSAVRLYPAGANHRHNKQFVMEYWQRGRLPHHTSLQSDSGTTSIARHTEGNAGTC